MRNQGRIFIKKNFKLNGMINKPGVYAVIVTNCMNRDETGKFNLLSEHILYIGSSNNIGKRVIKQDHPYRIAYDRISDYNCPVCVFSYPCDNYKQVEMELITLVKPLLNKQYAAS